LRSQALGELLLCRKRWPCGRNPQRVSITNIVMRDRIIRLQSDGFLKLSDRWVVLIEGNQKTAEVGARFGVVWLDPNCFAISIRGLGILDQHVIGVSQIVLSIGKIGSGTRGFEESLERLRILFGDVVRRT